MTTQLLSKLNELIDAKTGLSFSLREIKGGETNKAEINAFLCSNVGTKEQVCHAVFYFRMNSNAGTVSMHLHDIALHNQTPNLDKCFNRLSETLIVSKKVLESKEVLAEFENYSNTKEESLLNAFTDKVQELSKTHTLLDAESASVMLDKYINLVRKQQEKEYAKGFNGCVSKHFRLIKLSDCSSEIVHNLSVSIEKRTVLRINGNVVSKADALLCLKSKWAPKVD